MMDLRNFSNKRICVAVSGGVDSVTLLHYLKSCERECGYSLSAAHCEHGIRGKESLADMRFVEELCKAWGVPLFIFSEDCPTRAKREKESLETAARNFRYESFASLVEGNKVDFVALAHHKNDEAETVLFRLARGTSLTGVGGMVEMSGCFLRPLLSWTRVEIVEYAVKNNLSWREDQTNGETDATRNKLRLEVLPKLEEAVPGVAENLVRFASLASEDDALLYEYAKTLLSVKETEGETFVSVAFSDKKPLFRRACLLALKTLGVEKDYTALHLENLYNLQSLERGARQSLPQGLEAERQEKVLLFYKKKPLQKAEKGAEKIFDKNGFDGGMYLVSVSEMPVEKPENSWKILKVDEEKLPKNAVFRFRKEGDYIRRFGSGKKTLKKFFNEEKTPVAEREYLPVIAEKDGSEVYVVCGVEISESVKITEETKKTLYIMMRKK